MKEGHPQRLFGTAFVLLLAVQALSGFSFCVFYLLPKFLTTTLHATPSEVGLVSSSFGFAGALALPLLTIVVEKRAPRTLMLLAALALTISAMAFIAVRDVGMVAVLLRGLQGLAWSIMFIAGMVLTARLAPASRLAEAIGYFGVASVAMSAIAPAAAEALVDLVGWRPVFALAALVASVSWVLVYRLPSERPIGGAGPSVWAVLVRPSSLSMVVITTIWGAAFGAMFVFHQPFALSLGVRHVRGFFIAYALAALAARLAIGPLVQRLGSHRLSVASLGLYAAVVLAMQRLVPAYLVGYGAVFGLAHGFLFPAYIAFIVENAPLRERGRLVALCNGGFNAGYALGGLVFGAVAEHFGYPRLYLGAGLTTIAGVVLLALGPQSSAVGIAQRHIASDG
jgi:predicted MFS family arabinose efflux permease